MRFLSKTPKETRKLQIRPHLEESKGCLKQNKNTIPNAIIHTIPNCRTVGRLMVNRLLQFLYAEK